MITRALRLPSSVTGLQRCLWGWRKVSSWPRSYSSLKMELGYEKLASCEVAGVPIEKYKSTRSGLVACLAQVEGPLVNGYFCLGEL